MSDADPFDSARMIRDSVGAITPRGDLHRIRALRNDALGIDGATWRQIVELGWLALLLPEEHGGLGLGVRELVALSEELGGALVPEPVAAVATMVPLLPDKEREAVLAGTMIVVPARRGAGMGADDAPSASVSDGRVTGTRLLVASAPAADAFVVSIGTDAVLVSRDATGLDIKLARTEDGGHFGTLAMTDSPCVPLGKGLNVALHALSLAHCGYMLGAAERAFQMTLEYLGVRKQFGRYIGSFQVLQHRAAEAKIQLALSRAVLDEAVVAASENCDNAQQRQTAWRALARTSDTAMLVMREAIQMHGAIGITDEHDIGLYCRKILTIYNQFGSASHNRTLYIDSLGLETPA